MGIEDYLQSARYRRRLALDYRFLFPNLMDPDELALANLTREQLESAYEIRLHQIETYNGKDRKAAEEQRSRLNASLQHLIAFADERDAMVRRIGADDGWCEDPSDRHYNRPVKLPPRAKADRLARKDHLYDFIIEIDHNTRPRVAGRGSAVFIHVARPGFAPTAGCVALPMNSLRRLLARVGPRTKIMVE